MSYSKTSIHSNSPSKFAWDVFNELVKHYSITLGSRSGNLYNIPGSSFGSRSMFSSKKTGGYLPKTITIAGTPLFLSKDWYSSTKGLCIYDNLKDFVFSLTSKRFMVQDDSASGGEKYVLYEDASIPYSSTTSGKSGSAEICLSNTAEKCKELLEANYNIILSGAPGTGKTYMANQIALAITGSEDRKEFVQFHPSYDYTDFVEGLRPTPPSGSTIGFERKDGIFKEFCEKALKDSGSASISSAVTASSPSSVTTAYKSLAAAIKSGTVSSLPLKSKGVSMDASVSSQDNIVLSTHGTGKSYTVSLDDILTLSKVYQNRASLGNMKSIDNEIREVVGDRHSSSIWAVLHEIYDRMESEESATQEQHKYVFIIDEINRGEISKVFGELFFSVDPGYRGTKGKVRTQYANMVSEPNAFDIKLGVTDPKDCGQFFVPENVYIIGTMNDIDRSVDTMDFAMRRRFLIKEIKAEDTQNEMLKDEDVKAKMNALNKIIEDTSEKRELKARLGSAYALGASYFMKYDNYSGTPKDKFKSLWDNHLEGILREYLRGTADPDHDLKTLTETYFNA